jgi:DNA-binding CsgD family transcriptional regulator
MKNYLAPVIDAANQRTREDATWLGGVVRAAHSALGIGVLGIIWGGARRLSARSEDGLAPAQREGAELLLNTKIPEALYRRFPEGSAGLLSEQLPELSGPDALYLSFSGEGGPAFLFAPLVDGLRPSARQRRALLQIHSHLAVGYQLRKDEPSREDGGDLRAAALAFGAPAERALSEEARTLWHALLEGRLTFVDHFDREGRRYLVMKSHEHLAPTSLRLCLREGAVLELAGLGYSNRQIARRLRLSIPTVATYLSHSMAKLGIASRLQLIQLYAALILNA